MQPGSTSQTGTPRVPLGLLRNEMDRLFDDFWGDGAAHPQLRGPQLRGALASRKAPSGSVFPAVNVWEDQENYYVEAECPGCRIEQLDLTVTGNELTIEGERTEAILNGLEGQFHRRARGVGPFQRVIMLPTDVDPTKVEASLKNGILTVRLPKAESARPRKISVRS